MRVYLSGLSMNRIAFLLRVSAQAVLHWIRAFAREHDQKLELDEMWHYLKKKRLLAEWHEVRLQYTAVSMPCVLLSMVGVATSKLGQASEGTGFNPLRSSRQEAAQGTNPSNCR